MVGDVDYLSAVNLTRMVSTSQRRRRYDYFTRLVERLGLGATKTAVSDPLPTQVPAGPAEGPARAPVAAEQSTPATIAGD